MAPWSLLASGLGLCLMYYRVVNSEVEVKRVICFELRLSTCTGVRRHFCY